MKGLRIMILLTGLFVPAVWGNGAAVKDAVTGKFLRLLSSSVQVTVEGQISSTKVTNVFKNVFETDTIKYAFPLAEQASATQLRWKVNGQWYNASMAGTPMDTTLPGTGGQINANLKTYLGKTPLYFGIPQVVSADSELTVELTYVELLPYKFGKVSFLFKNDYRLIQNSFVINQSFQFYLSSQRTIDSLFVQCSYPVGQVVNNGSSAIVTITATEFTASSDYKVDYVLNANQLGLLGYSSFMPLNQVPDSAHQGFFTFIAEPDPSDSAMAINKVFTLIIDRSGSMSGLKMEQAKNAAKFIVQNLNQGDKFNLIDFDDLVTSFRPAHVPYTPEYRDLALAYINMLTARNLTSISGAFGTAIPQFQTSNDSTANIIVFFTDGQPTAGITAIEPLVNYITQLVQSSEKRIVIYSFGIGSDVNAQLLTLISSRNKGFAQLLGNDELYARITEFYLSIRNPVLLNASISFLPPLAVETYPDSLPNLYKGSQMIIAGRYAVPGTTQVTLSGEAFGRPVSYQYNLPLVDSLVTTNQFLPKLWAKRKIESLLVRYYSLPPGSGQAQALKAQIISISVKFGVMTSFTSFTGGGGGTGVEDLQPKAGESIVQSFEVLGNYPNPFNSSTTIKIRVSANILELLEVKIYSATGELVKLLPLVVRAAGEYSVTWDGTDRYGSAVPSGAYLCVITGTNSIAVHKMVLLK